MTHQRSQLSRMMILVVVAVFASTSVVAAAGDLASVRYQKSGSGHLFLSTHTAVPVGDLEASLQLFLLDKRYVAIYTETRRKSASASEVVLNEELSGSVSAGSLGDLGTLRVLGESANGKPVVELVLTQAVHSSPRGLALRLSWTHGSWAPRSVQ